VAGSTGSTSPVTVPVFQERIEGCLTPRVWRSVDVSSISGLQGCKIEVDSAEYPVQQPDPVLEILKITSKFIRETGGAIPAIVSNTLNLDADWQSELEALAQARLDDGSFSKIFDVLRGKTIRIFGNTAPYVSATAEGSAVWSLDSTEYAIGKKKAPDLTKAVLYIFVRGFEALESSLVDRVLAGMLLGRIRTLIHEIVQGSRFMNRLDGCHGTLSWSRNNRNDWCIEENEFVSEIATPPKLGPNPMPAKANSGYPADAGRTWEHSVTGGMAIFQRDMEFVISTNGKIDIGHIPRAEAENILQDPSELIRISRAAALKAASGRTLDTYLSSSELILQIEYQCQGSAGWILNHLDELDSLMGNAPSSLPS
jgi:hypothetical protein